MYAIIKTGGKQYKVAEGDVLNVEKLDAEKGAEVVFDEVLAIVNDGEVTVGKPFIDGATRWSSSAVHCCKNQRHSGLMYDYHRFIQEP